LTALATFAALTLSEEILDLKRHAILLAHQYQEPEIQEIADVVADRLRTFPCLVFGG
jgi:quinolinate synthase